MTSFHPLQVHIYRLLEHKQDTFYTYLVLVLAKVLHLNLFVLFSLMNTFLSRLSVNTGDGEGYGASDKFYFSPCMDWGVATCLCESSVSELRAFMQP